MQNNITVLMPGGFKPPHDGHLSLANKFASRSDVDKVLVMVGPTEREGINRKQSLAIWNALPKNPKVKVIPVSEDNPMTAAFKYVFNLPKDSTETIALGSSSKDPDDAKRAKIFRLAIEKYKNTPSKNGETAPPNIVVTDLTDDVYSVYKNRTDDLNGSSISATTLRNDLKNNDFNNFKTNYPNIDERAVKKIFHILASQLTERQKKLIKKFIRKVMSEDVDSQQKKVDDAKKRANNYLAIQKQEELKLAQEELKDVQAKLSNDVSIYNKEVNPEKKKQMDASIDAAREKVKNAEEEVRSKEKMYKSAVQVKSA